MAARQKDPLRELTAEEVKTLSICVRATSERVDRRQRAQAPLAVAHGASFSDAARQAGYRTGDSVARLLGRFHQHGVAALDIGGGRGRKPTTRTAVEREAYIDDLVDALDQLRMALRRHPEWLDVFDESLHKAYSKRGHRNNLTSFIINGACIIVGAILGLVLPHIIK